MLPWPRLMDCSICVAIPLKQCATFLKPFHGFTGRLWLEYMYFTSQRFLQISGLLALRFLKLWTLVNLFVLVYVSATFDGQRYEVWCQWCPSRKYSTITMASESTMEKKNTIKLTFCVSWYVKKTFLSITNNCFACKIINICTISIGCKLTKASKSSQIFKYRDDQLLPFFLHPSAMKNDQFTLKFYFGKRYKSRTVIEQ